MAFPPRYVAKSAHWIRTNRATVEAHIAATALVVERPVLRLAMQAIFWAARPGFPMQAFATTSQANAWLCPHLDKEVA